jgi:hypothetical protein
MNIFFGIKKNIKYTFVFLVVLTRYNFSGNKENKVRQGIQTCATSPRQGTG